MDNRIIIEPGSKSKRYWSDLWKYRGLFYFLAWKDVLVRYKQTSIGIAWSVIRPLLTMAVMWFLSWIAQMHVPAGIPRILFICAATLPWQFFSAAFSEASNSLVANSNLLTKVYFPRLIIPASTVIVCLIDFLISFLILLILMPLCHFMPGWRILMLPLFLALALIIAIGAGLIITALNVRFRDFKYIVPFMVQFGVYVCPVAFSSDYIYANTHIPQAVKLLYSLNPMVGVIDGFRWCILGNSISLYMPGFLLSLCLSLFLLLTGLWYFRKTEKSFADVI
ncbi:MAG TPA: ABC transporter permease [Bacteroidia bacterium]|jgi:lipopolysaccharide transport system permease protein|nr:ABC transporter permease [Bacteroidia bacterium]